MSKKLVLDSALKNALPPKGSCADQCFPSGSLLRTSKLQKHLSWLDLKVLHIFKRLCTCKAVFPLYLCTTERDKHHQMFLRGKYHRVTRPSRRSLRRHFLQVLKGKKVCG